MMALRGPIRILLLAMAAYALCVAQSPGPGREIANGAGNIGVGAAKGAGHLAAGSAKAAGNLITLHPIDAAVSAGHGAGSAGKDVAVGTLKGTRKIGKGVGRLIRKVL